jgi:hypothetical protein
MREGRGEVLQLSLKRLVQHRRQQRVEFHPRLRLQLLQRIDSYDPLPCDVLFHHGGGLGWGFPLQLPLERPIQHAGQQRIEFHLRLRLQLFQYIDLALHIVYRRGRPACLPRADTRIGPYNNSPLNALSNTLGNSALSSACVCDCNCFSASTLACSPSR